MNPEDDLKGIVAGDRQPVSWPRVARDGDIERIILAKKNIGAVEGVPIRFVLKQPAFLVIYRKTPPQRINGGAFDDIFA